MSNSTSAAAFAVARVCRCDAGAAVQMLATAAGLARWNLGLWNTVEVAPGLLQGRSLFDGTTGLARVQVDVAAGRVRYAVGAAEAALQPRIEARVQPGPELGHADDCCVVTLLAWRPATMSDERWQRLVAAHEVEIDIIRGQLERDAQAAAGQQRK